MAEKIAVIDFPPKGKETSFFVVNGVNGGLVDRIKAHGFEPDLVAYNSSDLHNVDPRDYAAVFFASGFTEIRDYSSDDPKKINPNLESTCNLYESCIDKNVPVVAFTHGGQILTFHTGGDYFPLNEKRTRMEPFGGYTPVDEDALNHWLLDNIPRQVLQSKGFAREYREYGIKLTGSDFKPLVLPNDTLVGPAIAVHNDPAKFTVLFMMHPEYNNDLQGYGLMKNIFEKLKQ